MLFEGGLTETEMQHKPRPCARRRLQNNRHRPARLHFLADNSCDNLFTFDLTPSHSLRYSLPSTAVLKFSNLCPHFEPSSKSFSQQHPSAATAILSRAIKNKVLTRAHTTSIIMDQRELDTRLKALQKAVAEKESASTVISILETLKKEVVPTEELLRVSSLFMSRIPHDCMRQPAGCHALTSCDN